MAPPIKSNPILKAKYAKPLSKKDQVCWDRAYAAGFLAGLSGTEAQFASLPFWRRLVAAFRGSF